MTSRRPRLAIVVPTRNRPELAGAAIDSALSSAIADLRLIVSDNSTDVESTRRLRAACQERGDPRLTYVRAPRSMTVAEHWQWALEQALELAGVSHLSYLTDRMIYQRGALEAVLELVANAPDAVLSYNHDRVEDYRPPVRLVQEPWSGAVVPLPSAELLERAAQGDPWHPALPRMLNCVVPVSLLDELQRRFGSVFASAGQDSRFAYRCLSLVDTVRYYDRPCLIHYALHRSVGANYARGGRSTDVTDFLITLGHGPQARNAPMPGIQSVINVMVHEYCSVAAESRSPRFKPVDLGRYMERLALDVRQLEDVSLRHEAYAQLRARGWRPVPRFARLAARARRDPAGLAMAVVRRVRRRLGAVTGAAATKPLWMLLTRFGIHPPASQRFRFASSAEALEYAARFPRSATPRARR